MITFLKSYMRYKFGLELCPIEILILEKTKLSLGENACELFDKQVQATNTFVRRGNRETSLYEVQDGDYVCENMEKFPANTTRALSTLVFLHPSTGKSLRAQVWLVRGRACYIKFRAFRRFLWNPKKLKLEDVCIHFDPMIPTPPPPEPASLALQAAEWVRKYDLSDLRAPGDAEERTSGLKEFNATFPVDYLELLGQTDGLILDEVFMIFGIGDIYPITFDDETYVLIAECPAGTDHQGMLGLKEGDTVPDVYHLGYDAIKPVHMGTTLREPVEKMLT